MPDALRRLYTVITRRRYLCQHMCSGIISIYKIILTALPSSHRVNHHVYDQILRIFGKVTKVRATSKWQQNTERKHDLMEGPHQENHMVTTYIHDK